MKRGIVALMVVFGFASPAQAAPGDPRLVQGVLEWPAKLTVEPFVVIRADDGRWYYAEVKAAKRFESGPLSAGGRVTVLGTEAARPHEIAAIAFGSGDAAALALALMPHVNAPASAPAPAPAAQPPGSPRTESLPAKVEPTATPKAEVPTPKAVAKAEPVATTPVAASTPATRPAPAVTTTPVAAPVQPAPAAPSVLASPPTAAPSLRPGAAIALYGTPTEQKFQAMGIVPPDNRPAPRPATIPPRR